MARIDISLLSHTNVGKTTLARTLLRRDIGEVGDRAHVTDTAESDVLIETAEGDSLVLWDTPGFGDSARLLKRLQRADQAVGWFLSQVWDRFADRPFWCGQQAVRAARETSDVILYVVNASEQPAAAAYVAAEMQILEWIQKPIVLLLNQLGQSGGPAQAAQDVAAWQEQVAKFSCVRSVLPFDAFARCWVQEGTLLNAIQSFVPAEKQAGFTRLRAAWADRNLDVFGRSMRVLAEQVAATASDAEAIAERGLQDKAREWFASLTSGSAQANAQLERAQTALATRLDKEIRAATQELVRLHGLTGKATQEVLQRMGQEFAIDQPVDADKAGVLGGLVSGALGGLAADLGAGGLTFGAGALLGSVLGAFGARGLAKTYNLARGSHSGVVRWSSEFLTSRFAAALMRYLAVAHFGRGRGDFVAGSAPAHWLDAVRETLERHRVALEAVWGTQPIADRRADTASALLPVATQCARDVLMRLYPDSGSMLR